MNLIVLLIIYREGIVFHKSVPKTENFSNAGKQKNKNQAVKITTLLNNDISEQQCCSNLYSRVMPIKCCCKWLDNNEIFRASLKKSI
jgi:hypothetical protein